MVAGNAWGSERPLKIATEAWKKLPPLTDEESQGINLPTELWLEILSYITAPSLKSLTRTCTTFRWLAQPLLFKLFILYHHQTRSELYSARAGRDTYEEEDDRARLVVLRYPHITSTMTELRLLPSSSVWSDPASLDLNASCDLMDAIFAALPSLPNLRTLVCHGINFTKEYLVSLCHLPRLVDLELQSCTTTCQPEHFPDLSLDALETLIFNYPHDSSARFGNHHFLSFLLRSRNIRCVQVGPNDDILHSMDRFRSLPTVSTLELPANCIASPLFIPALYVCEYIQEISLYGILPGDLNIPFLDQLPPSVVPNLRSYRGPQACAHWFLRGRDVKEVEFTTLSSSSTPLAASLGLPKAIDSFSCRVESPDLSLFTVIHKALPSLKHLSISGVPVDVDCLSAMLFSAERHLGLTSIQLSIDTGLPRLTNSWGITVAVRVLSRLLGYYPNLQHVKLVYQPDFSVIWSHPGIGVIELMRQMHARILTSGAKHDGINVSDLQIVKCHDTARTNAIWDLSRFKL